MLDGEGASRPGGAAGRRAACWVAEGAGGGGGFALAGPQIGVLRGGMSARLAAVWFPLCFSARVPPPRQVNASCTVGPHCVESWSYFTFASEVIFCMKIILWMWKKKVP